MSRFKTIKEYAQHLLTATDFVDCYGRNVGLDYETILAKIKREFPGSRTTMRALRYILHYEIERSVRLPARHRSRRILAREYAKSLLLRRDSRGVGLSFGMIRRMAQGKFKLAAPSLRTLKSWEDTLTKDRITLPERRAV